MREIGGEGRAERQRWRHCARPRHPPATLPSPLPSAGAIAKKRASAAARPASSVSRPKLAIVEDEPAAKAAGGCCK